MANKKFTKAEKKTADALWEYTKQANMQSDQLEMGFSQGITYGGDMDNNFSYSFGDLGELTFPEEGMRDKYPALKQAWEHYQSVLEVCKTKEQEDED